MVLKERKESTYATVCLLKEMVTVGRYGSSYKLTFKIPSSDEEVSDWFSVKNIADLQEGGKRNLSKKEWYRQQLRELIKQPTEEYDEYRF